ncbi:hypothetical protein JCM3766R1_002590 [Sporobolomyces carnicolor]
MDPYGTSLMTTHDATANHVDQREIMRVKQEMAAQGTQLLGMPFDYSNSFVGLGDGSFGADPTSPAHGPLQPEAFRARHDPFSGDGGATGYNLLTSTRIGTENPSIALPPNPDLARQTTPSVLPTFDNPFPFPTLYTHSSSNDLALLDPVQPRSSPLVGCTGASPPPRPHLVPFIPPPSIPSFPTAPTRPNAMSHPSLARATPSVPFPSSVLEAESSLAKAKPRSSVPPPSIQPVPIPTFQPHLKNTNESRAGSRQPSVVLVDDSPREGHGRDGSGESDRLGAPNRKGRESHLCQGGGEPAIEERDEQARSSEKGKGRATISGKEGATETDLDMEDEDDEYDNVVLVQTQSKRKHAIGNMNGGGNAASEAANSKELSSSASGNESTDTSSASSMKENSRDEAERHEDSGIESGSAPKKPRTAPAPSEASESVAQISPEPIEAEQALRIRYPNQDGIGLPSGWFWQDCTCNSGRKKATLPGQRTATSVQEAAGTHVCWECRGKKPGFTCLFKEFRAFRQLPDGSFDVRGTYFRREPDVAPRMLQASDFNTPFTANEAAVLKTTASDKLGPTIKIEFEHASQAACRRVSRDVSVLNTCDTCLHVMFCGSWICDECAREFCFDCYSTLKASETKGRRVCDDDSGNSPQVSKATLTRIAHCYKFREKRIRHASSNFTPLTRIDLDELKTMMDEMDAWRAKHPVERPKELPQGWIEQFFHQPDDEENSHPYLLLPSNLVPPSPEDYVTPSMPMATDETSDVAKDDPLDDLVHPPRPIPALPEGISPDDFFRAIWSRGEAMVVEVDLSQVSSINWSPEYFVENFGNDNVSIGSNLPQVSDHRETVGSFFARFGKQGVLSKSEKIKDWPPSTDFREDFPQLWQDFNQMLPMGSVTRRDGVLNISTHTPPNANPPDLGPKGYFSEFSDDTSGGQGSTKLHTVNVLLWSSTGPRRTAGIAVWDLYRAEDADKIREFLYELIAADRKYRGDVAKARMEQDDPIHTQRFFLDQKLRKELWEKKGVKSWRIQQKPGQVVFVPAGCAHQVCNLSACIKVASDFVSIENVDRCWKVTDEFRQQTKEDKVWKSDILALKSQLYWAWQSAKRLDS